MIAQLMPDATHHLPRVWQVGRVIWVNAIDNGPVRLRFLSRVFAHGPAGFHGTLHRAKIEVHPDADFAGKVQVPVHRADEEAAANKVAERCWDHGLPDVVASTERCAAPDTPEEPVSGVKLVSVSVSLHGNKEHISNYVVQRECHEGCSRPPNRNDLPCDVTGTDRDEYSKADKPIRANGPEEDLMPLRLVRLLDRQPNRSFRVLRCFLENAAVPRDDSHEEETTSEVAEVRDEPVLCDVQEAHATMQEGSCHVHDVGGPKVGAAENDHDEA